MIGNLANKNNDVYAKADADKFLSALDNEPRKTVKAKFANRETPDLLISVYRFDPQYFLNFADLRFAVWVSGGAENRARLMVAGFSPNEEGGK